MSEMVERVARRMWERTHDGSWPDDGDPGTVAIYREDARAAIEAMREPTEAVIRAGAARIDFDERVEEDIQPGQFAVAWRAGIDAALKD